MQGQGNRSTPRKTPGKRPPRFPHAKIKLTRPGLELDGYETPILLRGIGLAVTHYPELDLRTYPRLSEGRKKAQKVLGNTCITIHLGWGRGGAEARALASHISEPGYIPGGVTPRFFVRWGSCRTIPLVGGFSRRSPVSRALEFRLYSILTLLHPHLLSRHFYVVNLLFLLAYKVYADRPSFYGGLVFRVSIVLQPARGPGNSYPTGCNQIVRIPLKAVCTRADIDRGGAAVTCALIHVSHAFVERSCGTCADIVRAWCAPGLKRVAWTRASQPILVKKKKKTKSKYINRIRLENASQQKSSDTHKTPYDRVKRCRERKINIKASERVNVDSARRRGRGGLAVSSLASHQGDLGSNPDDAIGRRVFSGSPASPAHSFRRRSILTSIALICRPNIFTSLQTMGNRNHGILNGESNQGPLGRQSIVLSLQYIVSRLLNLSRMTETERWETKEHYFSQHFCLLKKLHRTKMKASRSDETGRRAVALLGAFLASQTSSPLLEVSTGLATTQKCSCETGRRLDPPRRIKRVGENSRWRPKTIYILPQPSGRQSLVEAAGRECASEVKYGRRLEIAGRWRVRCSWLEWTRGNRSWARSGVMVRLLTSRQVKPDSIRGNSARRCRWLAGFLCDLPFSTPLHYGAAPYSPRFILIGNVTDLSPYNDVQEDVRGCTVLIFHCKLRSGALVPYWWILRRGGRVGWFGGEGGAPLSIHPGFLRTNEVGITPVGTAMRKHIVTITTQEARPSKAGMRPMTVITTQEARPSKAGMRPMTVITTQEARPSKAGMRPMTVVKTQEARPGKAGMRPMTVITTQEARPGKAGMRPTTVIKIKCSQTTATATQRLKMQKSAEGLADTVGLRQFLTPVTAPRLQGRTNRNKDIGESGREREVWRTRLLRAGVSVDVERTAVKHYPSDISCARMSCVIPRESWTVDIATKPSGCEARGDV
ncbi:hypothetical protein PR048_019264 [Dryococelus australis]|uniref:Uncharacterized protein n=1 Tax=Dryococelus australis TaxID=614101 RepID=A0ABQ9H332_9NEOP|nr:hypothetical protein PR048_019264 [Dryococelus australis]